MSWLVEEHVKKQRLPFMDCSGTERKNPSCLFCWIGHLRHDREERASAAQMAWCGNLTLTGVGVLENKGRFLDDESTGRNAEVVTSTKTRLRYCRYDSTDFLPFWGESLPPPLSTLPSWGQRKKPFRQPQGSQKGF